MNRKKFIYGSILGLGVSVALPTYFIMSARNKNDLQAQKSSNQLNRDLVKEFVVAGHSKLNLVKEMLAEYPNLIYSAYDWGNGDYELAIEGAAHLGNKEIVNFLVSKGARVNLFILTMLGEIELVKSTIEAYPNLLHSKGPHGLTLLHHAQVVKCTALENYFREKGLTTRALKIK